MNLEYSLEKIKIEKIMSDSFVSVDSSIPATDAAKMMERADVGAVMVLENGYPIGIITDRDFAIKITAHSYPLDTPVRRVMSSPLISIDSTSDLQIVFDLMSSRKVRTLPVIDDEKVVGIVTSSGIVRYLSKHLKS
jgi:signal-transduction protein with cAMP-binding, CBS, and nucleotidyltransferase domain